jgi:hypothetical protein
LYRAWDRVRDPDAVLGYLRTAVVNGARSVHRSRRRARLLRVRHDPPVWSAEAAVVDREDRRAVLAAMAALPQRQREVLAGPARRPRWPNALIPVAAAVTVLAVIAASVALPRLLTGPHLTPRAADADGGVIAFPGQRSSGLLVVGVVIGNQVKQWSVSDRQAVVGNVSVTSAANKIAFMAQYNGPGSHFAAMVLATSSAPGSLRAKTVGSCDYPR